MRVIEKVDKMALNNEQRRDLLIRFLEERGVRLHYGRNGWQKVSCFGTGHLKGDRNPSASVNLGTGHYRCFGCDLAGDAVDLVMQEERLDFKSALGKMGMESGKQVKESRWI